MKENHFCVNVDLPGHGATPNPIELNYSFDVVGRSLISFLKELKLKQVSLIGYSMGGRLALYLIWKYPKYFRKAILESVSPGIETEEERMKRIQEDEVIAKKLESQNFKDFLNEWYSQPLFWSLRKSAVFDDMIQRRSINNPQALATTLRAISTGRQPSLWGELKKVQVPNLLVIGEYDKKYQTIASKMLKNFSHAELKVVKGAGHNIHLENPADYAEICQHFLNTDRGEIA